MADQTVEALNDISTGSPANIEDTDLFYLFRPGAPDLDFKIDGLDLKAYVGNPLTLGTPVATTSGTSIDITGIPSGTKKITINFKGVSTNGSSNWLVQIGDSGGIEGSGYLSSSHSLSTGVANTTYTAGYGMRFAGAVHVVNGSLTLTLEDAAQDTWCLSGVVSSSSGNSVISSGEKSLTGVLDRIRLTTVGGVNTFDAGELNIAFE